MPYLIRRAEENTSVAGQTSRELTLIKAEENEENKSNCKQYALENIDLN
jgi:proline dehydrogenase